MSLSILREAVVQLAMTVNSFGSWIFGEGNEESGRSYKGPASLCTFESSRARHHRAPAVNVRDGQWVDDRDGLRSSVVY